MRLLGRMLNPFRRQRLIWATIISFVPLAANAAALTPRSLSLSSSQAGVVTSHVFNLTTGTAASIGSIKFAYCTTASGACTVPTGLVTTGATLAAQSGAITFSMVNTTNGAPLYNAYGSSGGCSGGT